MCLLSFANRILGRNQSRIPKIKVTTDTLVYTLLSEDNLFICEIYDSVHWPDPPPPAPLQRQLVPAESDLKFINFFTQKAHGD